MNKILSFTIATLCSFGALMTTSCSKEDPVDITSAGDKGVDKEEIKTLVSSVIPEEGFSDTPANGVWTYGIENDGDKGSYLAFDMKDGICRSAAFNLVLESEKQAKKYAKIFNNGIALDDEDEDDEVSYDYIRSKAPAGQHAGRILGYPSLSPEKINRLVASSEVTRSDKLVIPVSVSGRVIYIMLPNFKGATPEDIEDVIDYWNGYYGTYPDRVIFGSYHDGVYSCNDFYGIGMNYRVETTFNSKGYCTKYVTRITCPSGGWAKVMYQSLEEQADQMEMEFGLRPTVTLNGHQVSMDAVIIGDVTREMVDEMIYYIDWSNNRPFLMDIF